MDPIKNQIEVDKESLEKLVNELVDRKVKERIAQFLDHIKDLDKFLTLWMIKKKRQSSPKMGFLKLSKALSTLEPPGSTSKQDISLSPVFQHEDLPDRQPRVEEELQNAADINRFMDRDVTKYEAHLRRALGNQFGLDVEAGVEEIMDKEEQQLKKGKELAVKKSPVQPEESKSSPVDEEIDTVMLEEKNRLLAYYMLVSDKPVSTQEVGERLSAHFCTDF